MAIVADCLLLVIATFLLFSAAAKAVSLEAAVGALTDLGIPRPYAQVGASLATSAEASVAVGIALWPGALLVQLACIVLFAAFAVAGAFALWIGRPIDCGCFGSLRRSSLGRTQVLEFAVVAPAVLLSARLGPGWTTKSGVTVLFAAELVVFAVLLSVLLPRWRRLRTERLSLYAARAAARRLGSTVTRAPGAEGRA